MASGLTPWLALELPDDADEITTEMLVDWKKKQKLARLAATGCNVLYKELGLRRRMNFYFDFKKTSDTNGRTWAFLRRSAWARRS
jgi:hypothetical protein